MATKLDLLNRALSELGERILQEGELTITDRSRRRARIAVSAYEGVRQSLLNAHAWSWLEQRKQLAEAPRAMVREGPAPPEGQPDTRPLVPDTLDNGQPRYEREIYNTREFRHAFLLPDGKEPMRALYTSNADGAHPRPDLWRREATFISADYPVVWGAFQLVSQAESRFPPLVEDAMVLRLAQRMAPAFTEDPDTVSMFKRLADEALRDARRVDAQGQPAPRLTSFSYLEARLGGRRGYGIR